MRRFANIDEVVDIFKARASAKQLDTSARRDAEREIVALAAAGHTVAADELTQELLRANATGTPLRAPLRPRKAI